MNIRKKKAGDPAKISQAFAEQGWEKPVDLYEAYLLEQVNDERVVLVAEIDGAFAG
ncbi:MAG TPA: hypothetical protein VFK44_07620 [Bacillales bacterium]|nr:hypothetical protein [Bacillales bacterium]